MEAIENALISFVDSPLGLIIIGWFAFNILNFSMAKDLRDETDHNFPILPYIAGVWDNWAWSAIVGLVIFAVGQNKIDPSAVVGLQWQDSFYLLPGPASELLIVVLKKYRKALKKKEEAE